jgi:hypothetical protein
MTAHRAAQRGDFDSLRAGTCGQVTFFYVQNTNGVFCKGGPYKKCQEHRELEPALFVCIFHIKNANYNLLDSYAPIHSWVQLDLHHRPFLLQHKRDGRFLAIPSQTRNMALRWSILVLN